MNLLAQARLILRRYGIKPKHKLGQNFIVDEEVLRREIEYAKIRGSDVVLEVGAGLGTLTELLLQKAGKVCVVEKDAKMINVLKERFGGEENFEIICGDALKVKLPIFDVTVSNIPYAISSPLTFKLLKQKFRVGIITYQKEFAERMVGAPGTRNYSRLSVATYYYSKARILEVLSKRVFYPMPKVDSAIVELSPRKPPFKVNEEHFFKVLAGVFSQRGKTVRNAMFHSLFGGIKKETRRNIIEKNIPKEILEKRVFQLLPEEFAAISHLYGKIYLCSHQHLFVNDTFRQGHKKIPEGKEDYNRAS